MYGNHQNLKIGTLHTGHICQCGNALFLILIAVALFAALSYAVTNSGRGGGSSERERLEIAFAQLHQQAQGYRMAMNRLELFSNVHETEYSFVNDVWPSWLNSAGQYENTNCTTNDCLVFHDQGGGATYMNPPPIFKELCDQNCEVGGGNNFWRFSGNIFVPGIGQEDQTEMIAMHRVDQETCKAMNDRLGIENPGGDAPLIPSAAAITSGFQGNYGNPANKNAFTTMPAELAGKMSGCFNQGHGYYNSDYAFIYFVIMERSSPPPSHKAQNLKRD